MEMLNSDSGNGLNEGNCEFIREKSGSNKVELPTRNRTSKHIFKVLKHPFVIMNILIAVILIFLHYYLLGGIVSGLLLLNIICAVSLNINRDKEIGVLENINFENAVVIRDGKEKTIKCEDLVVGDIVKFKKNNLVPADIRIISANDVKVDEKSLTGEAFYKEKFESKISGRISSIADIKNMIFKGTVIKEGDGMGIVVGVGNATQLGRMLTMLTYANTTKHIFDKKLFKKCSNYIAPYFLILLVFGTFMFISQENLENTALGLFAVACFPITIISVIVFKIIVKKMNQEENIDIINFSVFELIKKVNLIFLDKIGSIGKNELIVRRVFTNNKIIMADDPTNRDINFDRIMEIGLICNNSAYDPVKETGKGDLIEVALLKYMNDKKTFEADLEAKNGKLFEIPVDSDKRFLTVVTRFKRRFRANSRGNIDAILDKCTHIMVDGVERELTAEQKNKIKDIDMRLSMQGYINEGFAYRNFNYEPSKSENIESNMVFVGFVSLENPLEDDYMSDITYMKDNAIVPILFTEESKLSAITNARKAGIIRSDRQVVSGIELNSLTVGELKELIPKVRVFCRTAPEIKSQIISLFKKDGHRIATVGETIGDIPSMNFADVGIAKGQASSMVRKSSEVYMKGNNLKGFFKIRKYAKHLEANMQRAFDLLNITLLAEVLILIVGQLIGKTNLFDIVSILFINGLLLIPMSIITVMSDGKEIKKSGLIVRSLILSGIVLGISYYSNSTDEIIIGYTVLALGTLIFNIFNNKVSFKEKSNELVMYILSIIGIVIVGVLLIVINNITLNNLLMIELGGSILFLIIFEILFGKWQDS